MNTTQPANFRFLCHTDFREVALTEACCFLQPWDIGTLSRTLNERDTMGLVAQSPGLADLGHVVYSLWSREVLTVRRFAVRPEYQGMGVGRAMVARLMSKLNPDRCTRIELCCRERNLDGQLFWRAVGFRAVEVVRNHYTDTKESAYIFAFDLPDAALMGVLPTGAKAEANP